MGERKNYENGKVIGNGLKKAGTGTDYISICVSVDIGEGKTKRFYGAIYLSFAAMERSFKILREVFEWKGKDIKDFNTPILVGKKVDIVVENDGQYENILFFNKPYKMDTLQGDALDSLVNEVQPMLDKLMAKENLEIDQTGKTVENSGTFSDGSPIPEEPTHF